MANRPRKRVHAIPRAPDGSAFKRCEVCGLSVAIALADLHQCATKKIVENKPNSQCWNGYLEKQGIEDQPRSAVRFFVTEFKKKCKDGNEVEIDNKACNIWKNMSREERAPFVVQADKLNAAYEELLEKEENDIQMVDDEADSAEVGKYDNKVWDMYYDSESCGGSGSFLSDTDDSFFGGFT